MISQKLYAYETYLLTVKFQEKHTVLLLLFKYARPILV